MRDAFIILDSANVCRVRSFWTFSDIKRYFITLPKVFEFYVPKLVWMEEKILFLAFASNEPKSPVGESSNCSFLHNVLNNLDWYSNQESSRAKLRRRFSRAPDLTKVILSYTRHNVNINPAPPIFSLPIVQEGPHDKKNQRTNVVDDNPLAPRKTKTISWKILQE